MRYPNVTWHISYMFIYLPANYDIPVLAEYFLSNAYLLHFQQYYLYFRLFTSSQKKTNRYPLTHHTWKMSPHYLAKCTTFSSDWRYAVFLQTLVALKKAGCGLALVAPRRTGCDMWQMECQASNVTANVQSDHLLRGYMLPVFFATDQLHCPPRSAEIQPCRKKMIPQLVHIVDSWYLIRVKKWKRWKICAFCKLVR